MSKIENDEILRDNHPLTKLLLGLVPYIYAVYVFDVISFKEGNTKVLVPSKLQEVFSTQQAALQYCGKYGGMDLRVCVISSNLCGVCGAPALMRNEGESSQGFFCESHIPPNDCMN